jgi:peptidoglycan/LPS O-acetylase OafA/YrhL
MPGGPLFLARAVYRRRRLRDAARLLPVLGLLLMLLPALGRDTSGDVRDAIYFFILWGVLIAAAAVLAPGLSATEGDQEADIPPDMPAPDMPAPAQRSAEDPR